MTYRDIYQQYGSMLAFFRAFFYDFTDEERVNSRPYLQPCTLTQMLIWALSVPRCISIDGMERLSEDQVTHRVLG